MKKSKPAQKDMITAFAEEQNGRLRQYGRICKQLCNRWKRGGYKNAPLAITFPFRYIGFEVAEPLTLQDIVGVAFI